MRLIVFDLDGTILDAPAFYKQVYSGTLTTLIEELRGEQGLEVLKYCRKQYSGKGELALIALGIPYSAWAQRLVKAPLELVNANPKLVEATRALNVIKVVYTGSPVVMARRVLFKIGFTVDDFDLVIGWQPLEIFPVKWTCSAMVFEDILRRFQVSAIEACAVGDTWDIDLAPAQAIGMKTIHIGKGEKLEHILRTYSFSQRDPRR